MFTRRLALGYASAFAATAGTTGLGLASAKQSALATSRTEPLTAQCFFATLIHRDAGGDALDVATLSVRSIDTAWVAIDGLSDGAYQRASEKYEKRDYRLRRLSVHQTRKGMRYAAIWQHAPGAQIKVRHDMSLAAFESTASDLAERGYRLSHIDAAGARYAAIWERGNAASQASFAALSDAELRRKTAELAAKGFAPRVISGHSVGGQSRYAAIFEANFAGESAHGLDVSAFREKARAMTGRGVLLTDASGHVAGGRKLFSGVWENV